MMRLLFSVLALSLITLPVWAQNNDMRGVTSRLDQIQRQMDTISRQVYSGNPPPEALSKPALGGGDNASLAAAVDERMNGLEGSVKQLNNRLDEQDYAVGQLKQQFEVFKSDLEVRLNDMQMRPGTPTTPSSGTMPSTLDQMPQSTLDKNPAATTPSAGTPTASTSDATESESLPTDNAVALYDAAFQALREQKYDRAEAGFKNFLSRYSSDHLAGNAQYWLGETYYVRGNYAEAAKTFAQGFQKFPKSTKAPDNLLKLGLSLSQSGKKQDACVTLQQLSKQYPTAAAVIKQRADDEMRKLNCGATVG